MAVRPPASLVAIIHRTLFTLLTGNPAATSSEAYVRLHVEFSIVSEKVRPRYYLRIGINYHGQKVQHLRLREPEGTLVGWNPAGDALRTGSNAKMLLAGHTIFPREPGEPMMNDTKIGGGDIEPHRYVRIEFKVRGWLGQTKNLDGKQLEKDIDLLKQDRADLLIMCLSETAHRKWRGEGPNHQASRRTGTDRFVNILVAPEVLRRTEIRNQDIDFEGQRWTTSSRRIIGSPTSSMPGAGHFVTMCWQAT